MPIQRIRRIQDSVHGLMEFYGVESQIIDLLATPELQRLRRVRQLGLGLLVFPAAEHTRFAHALGSAFVAVRFGRELQHRSRAIFVDELAMDESSTRDLAIAALCHDLGHGPLSHAWEREIIGEGFPRDKWCQTLGLDAADPRINDLKWHEMVAHGLLAWTDGRLHRLLESIEPNLTLRIRNLLLGDYFLPYVPRLISSDVDVDRCDFIRRDAHQTGVAYGRYDLNWLISTSALGEAGDESAQGIVFGFDERKAVRVVEQFLIARRAMYDTVYHHKTVRCAEGMIAVFLKRIGSVVRRGVQMPTSDVIEPLMRVVGGQAVGPEDILRLDDFALSVLVETVAQTDRGDRTARDLAQRLRARHLFKQIRVSSDAATEFLKIDGARAQLYDLIAPHVHGCKPEYYLVEDVVAFSMMASKPRNKVYLVNGDGSAVAAADHPAFELYKSQKLRALRLFTVAEAREDIERHIAAMVSGHSG
jgi:HD superfamily phosphohydrolase